MWVHDIILFSKSYYRFADYRHKCITHEHVYGSYMHNKYILTSWYEVIRFWNSKSGDKQLDEERRVRTNIVMAFSAAAAVCPY